MAKIHFHITDDVLKHLTWEDYEALEMAQEGDLKLHKLRPLLARFLVDDNLKPLSQPAAMKEIAKVSMDQVPDVIKSFITALKDKAVPKESGLLSPLESVQVEESQAGVAP